MKLLEQSAHFVVIETDAEVRSTRAFTDVAEYLLERGYMALFCMPGDRQMMCFDFLTNVASMQKVRETRLGSGIEREEPKP